MGFYPPEINPEVRGWKDEAEALPEPQGGGHILDAVLRMIAPQLRRSIGRWAEGSYEDQPWQTIAADALVPDQGAAAGVGEAMGMANPLAAGIVLNKGVPLTSYSQIAKDAPYRGWLTKFLRNPDVVIPYMPESYAEPIIAKTTGENVEALAKALKKPEWSDALGFHTRTYPEGSAIATTIGRQKKTLPHEHGHFLQKLWRQSEEGRFPDSPQARYPLEASELFEDLQPDLQKGILKTWKGRQGYDRTAFNNELIADLVRPQTFEERFPNRIAALASEGKGPFRSFGPVTEDYPWALLKMDIGNKYPALWDFWLAAPDLIHKNAYDLPRGWLE